MIYERRPRMEFPNLGTNSAHPPPSCMQTHVPIMYLAGSPNPKGLFFPAQQRILANHHVPFPGEHHASPLWDSYWKLRSKEFETDTRVLDATMIRASILRVRIEWRGTKLRMRSRALLGQWISLLRFPKDAPPTYSARHDLPVQKSLFCRLFFSTMPPAGSKASETNRLTGYGDTAFEGDTAW